MNERKYNVNKSVNRIDVFVDAKNRNNVWAIIEHVEYRNHKPFVQRELRRFANYYDMMAFLRTGNKQIGKYQEQIFYHDVDYINMNYYLHEGKPKLNYIELNYKEIVNGGYNIRKMPIENEWEETLLDIIRINKDLDKKPKLDSTFYRLIDVYANKTKESKRDYGNYLGSIPSKHSRVKQESYNKPRINVVKGLKIMLSVAALGAILAGGYELVKDHGDFDIVTQKNATILTKDARISMDEGKASKIIDALMDENYHKVTYDELMFVTNYIKEVGYSNFDNNASTSFFNYTDYFSYKLFDNNSNMLNIEEAKGLLGKIERLYNKCFVIIDNEVLLNKDGVNNYINYVASLTFMYDTTVDLRGSRQVQMNTQDPISKYATKEEVETYHKYPLILKYVIMTQLKGVISHSDYQVTKTPSNYFSGLDKQDLQNKATDIINSLEEQLKTECHGKTM